MALIRWYDEDEFFCSYSTLAVHDLGEAPDEDPAGDASGAPAHEQGPGTFVVAGAGWLECVAESDEFHHVRLELHDCPPQLDLAAWADVAETPYVATSGWTSVRGLMDEDVDLHLYLGGPGRYGARVAARRAASDEMSEFRFQFWPAPGDGADPPELRHLARDPDERAAYWRSEVEVVGTDLIAHVGWAQGRLRTSARTLAERTLLPVPDVVAALRRAAEVGRLRIEAGDPADPDAVLDLVLGTARHEEPDDGYFWDAPPDTPGARRYSLADLAEELPDPGGDGPWGNGSY